MPIRVRNISQGFVDTSGFHPIRSAWTAAKVRRTDRGDIQVLLVGRKRK